jgi:hypothetical protein
MPITPRQSDIMSRARQAGRVNAQALADDFAVTVQYFVR